MAEKNTKSNVSSQPPPYGWRHWIDSPTRVLVLSVVISSIVGPIIVETFKNWMASSADAAKTESPSEESVGQVKQHTDAVNHLNQPRYGKESRSLSIEKLELIPQTVNLRSYFDRPQYSEGGNSGKPRTQPTMIFSSPSELSTLRVAVNNSSSSSIDIKTGQFIVDDVEWSPVNGYPSRHVVLLRLIDHSGDIILPVTQPARGDIIPVAAVKTVPAGSMVNFRIWFQGIDPQAPEIMKLTGRLRLLTTDGQVIGEQVTLSLHRETQGLRGMASSATRSFD